MVLPAFAPGPIGIVLETLLSSPMRCDATQFERAVQASSVAGFRSVTLFGTHAAEMGVGTARAILDNAGVTARVTEFLTSWAEGPEAAVAGIGEVLDQIGALGADILLAVSRATTLDHARAREGFAALCEQAAKHDIKVAVEFIPCRAVRDLATAWRIVGGSGASNGGIVLDTMHFHYQPGGPQLDVLREIPGTHIHLVQLCDAAPGPPPHAEDYIDTALRARLLPGEGVVDFAATLATLVEIGAEPFFAMEIYNEKLVTLGPEAMAKQVRAAADDQFCDRNRFRPVLFT